MGPQSGASEPPRALTPPAPLSPPPPDLTGERGDLVSEMEALPALPQRRPGAPPLPYSSLPLISFSSAARSISCTCSSLKDVLGVGAGRAGAAPCSRARSREPVPEGFARTG